MGIKDGNNEWFGYRKGLYHLLKIIYVHTKSKRLPVNNNRVLDIFMDCVSTEYYSNALANSVNKENRNDWILVTRSRNVK